MEVDDITWHAIEADDVHPTGEGLQVGIGTGDAAKLIHHLEGIFVGAK